MKRAAYIVALLLSACCINLHAVDVALLMRTRTDPSRMRLVTSDTVNLLTGFMDGGESAVTVVTWVRVRLRAVAWTGFVSFWSADPARATREGGAKLPAIKEYAPVAATSGGTFADPHYDDCGLGGDWQYGCYAVNVQTDVPLTLTLAGAERQIAASNGVMQAFNIQGVAADWSWSLAGASAGNVSFGFGANPLVRFFGEPAQIDNETFAMSDREGVVRVPTITNEWFMCSFRVRLDGAGHGIGRQAGFNWVAEWFPQGESTNDVTRTSFAKDARVAMMLYSTGIEEVNKDVERYGVKVFPRWLTDDELRNVRDLDMFEMQRRGMSRWRYD